MSENDFRESIKLMRSRTGQLDREGNYWSEDEHRHLEHLFWKGVGISEMAVLLQRTEMAVMQQIDKMGLSCARQKRSNRRDKNVCQCIYCKQRNHCKNRKD
ncbi:MAG: hypothetical protein LUC47_10240 [Clostridiales bacterium]|nr:hypothetical protein [Clostridiales bacterium]